MNTTQTATPSTDEIRRETMAFPDRIELGQGYPWVNGVGPGYFEITMRHAPKGGINLPLDWPQELWSEKLPKYRLVLERIDKELEH